MSWEETTFGEVHGFKTSGGRCLHRIFIQVLKKTIINKNNINLKLS